MKKKRNDALMIDLYCFKKFLGGQLIVKCFSYRFVFLIKNIRWWGNFKKLGTLLLIKKNISYQIILLQLYQNSIIKRRVKNNHINPRKNLSPYIWFLVWNFLYVSLD